MHFSRSKLRTAPTVRHGDVEKHPKSALRWLGIWLDSRLSFRIHVEKWAAKAKAVGYRQFTSSSKHGESVSPPDSNHLMRLTLWCVGRDRPPDLFTTISSNEDIKYTYKAALEHGSGHRRAP
jgi:hypothetical protein